MSKLTLEFKTDTDAFEYDRATEAARILRHAADLVASGGDTVLRDLNGNTVGAWSIEETTTPKK